MLELTNSPFYVGLVTRLGLAADSPVHAVGRGACGPGRQARRALILLQTLMLLDALALALLTVTGLVTVPWVMALAVVHGTSSAFEVPIRQAFVIDMVGKDDLMNAIALNSSNFNLTRIVGPALAGVVIATAGVAPCFFLNAASFLAVISSFFAMREADAPRREAGGPNPATFAKGPVTRWGRVLHAHCFC